ncbi:MAG: ThuA domain-containing protein [Clostridia bacterium]|nr:ThuA domain-containing protein [Clostridia bacterium]
MIRVTVWNENVHEREHQGVRDIYPDGIHGCIAKFLELDEEIVAKTATLEMPSHGLTDEVLENTDVLIWWAHCHHHEVSDEIAKKVQQAVLKGMGLIVLHSGHLCKPFTLLMGTSCTLKWRDNDRERVWCCNPGHPIAKAIPEQFEIPVEEMYGEFFDIPNPDEVVFLGWFKGGEVFRSGVTFTRGRGRIFYFQPGHEWNPTYHIEPVQKIITNAVKWAAPTCRIDEIGCPNTQPLEK